MFLNVLHTSNTFCHMYRYKDLSAVQLVLIYYIYILTSEFKQAILDTYFDQPLQWSA